MRFFRICLIALSFFLATTVVAFFGYDLFYFQPYRTEIRTILANASPHDRDPPLLVTKLVYASEPNGIDSHLTRILYFRLTELSTDRSTARGLAHQLMLRQMIQLHMTKQERMSLYCSLVYSGNNDPGLSAASARLFKKPLPELTAPEAATIVALLHSPSYYERHQQRLIKRRDMLLQRLGVGL